MRTRLLIIAFIIVMAAVPASAAPRAVTIIHTNDMHSHFLGFAPNLEYTPGTTGDDATVGGWARISTVISHIREQRRGVVITVDAGDFMMGSIFHLMAREQAFEFQLLSKMDYDAVTLGNHEFDLKPDGLARIIESARFYNSLPTVVSSNLKFDKKSHKDDNLKGLYEKELIRPYTVITRGGVRIGLFGLLGKDAAHVAPFAKPVRFEDPVKSAERMVKSLRNREKVDLVVCLSHSGLSDDPDESEDEILARKVDGIDVIISGHTHTRLEQARIVNDTVIVQAGSYGREVGVLDLVVNGDEKVEFADWRAIPIDDGTIGDPEIIRMTADFEKRINEEVLAEDLFSSREPLAHIKYDLTMQEAESNLGNLVADSIRWYANRHVHDPADPSTKVVVGMISNGVIRDDIIKGKADVIAMADAFRAVPLGIGPDDTMGYPLVSFYLYGSELKKALEIITSVYPLKGSDYWLQISGIKFEYNPNRLIFDRVTDIWLGDEETGYNRIDYSESDRTLYRVSADYYCSSFLKVIGEFTYGFLDIAPKDKNGRAIDDMADALIDADPGAEGVQELKEWKGVLEYLRSFPDSDDDGMPDVPAKYAGSLDRVNKRPSWNPFSLVKRSAWQTRAAVLFILGGLFVAALVVRAVVKKKR